MPFIPPTLEESLVVLDRALKSNTQQIFDSFLTLPNSLLVKPNFKNPDILIDYTGVMVDGSRKDKVLLVAHADTVWNDFTDPVIDSGIYISGNKMRERCPETGRFTLSGSGIGADDRAGIAILWLLKNLGHSILIVGGEEQGCLGSHYIMGDQDRADWVQSHQFIIEFDRNGQDDLVFYNVGSKKFQEYCKKQTGYQCAHGTFTDICVLCEEICGVNISVGYKNEHTPNELLNTRQWFKTLTKAFNWLSSEEIPRFAQE